MSFRAIVPDELEWITRPHEPGEPARHVAELSDLAGFAHTRANLWRYEPVAGALTMYLGDPPKRLDVPVGGLIHVAAGTALQTVNHGDEDLLVYVYGHPPEDENAEVLD